MELEQQVIETIKASAHIKDDVTPDMNLKDVLDLDSLDIVEICYEVEEEFGLVIADEVIQEWDTVQDVINTVKRGGK